ncbi:MFS transporter [Ruania zhangjianzhongii]|uniref:MFS transporter n=1 Tax=Ruania zhangjianzhongii TaxID=2603206 RepID=UPI00165204ED|nr:MFS transporter [Ruania zhangjianzhongii]
MTEQLRRRRDDHDTRSSAVAGKRSPDRLPWPALITMTVAIFVVVSGEMMPTAVLPQLAAGLDVSLARAGLLVSAWALTVVVASFPLVRVTARVPRPTVIAGALLVAAFATVVTATTSDYPVAMASRLVAAAATGLLWSTINAHTASIVPAVQIGRATAVVLFGGTLGTVAAIPAGNAIAQWVGWRAPFLALAALTLLAAAAILLVLRRYPVRHEDQPVEAEAEVGARQRLRGLGPILVTTAFGGSLLIGHFAAFTFVAELFQPSAVPTPLLLLLFGLVGVGGVVGVGATSDRYPAAVPIVLAGMLALSLAGLMLIGGSAITDVAVVLVWGLTVGGLGPAIQTRVMRQAGTRHRTTAGTLIPVAMNLGIAAGSALGSGVLERASLETLAPVALVPTLVALLGFAVLGGAGRQAIDRIGRLIHNRATRRPKIR